MRLTSDGRPSARKRGYTVRWEEAELVGSYSSTPCVRASAKTKDALPLPSMSITSNRTVETSVSLLGPP